MSEFDKEVCHQVANDNFCTICGEKCYLAEIEFTEKEGHPLQRIKDLEKKLADAMGTLVFYGFTMNGKLGFEDNGKRAREALKRLEEK